MTSQLRTLSLRRVIAGLIAIACFVQAGRFFLAPQLSSSVEASVAAPHAAALPRYVPVPIEEIREGDYVLTRDEQTGEFTSKPVVQSFRRTSDHLRQVEVRSPDGETATIETTNEHPFWVAGQGWTKAADLQPDDTVTDETGQAVLVAATSYDPHDEGVAVFNFEVADTHSYYVQAPNARGPPVWVHNACGDLDLYQLEDFTKGTRYSQLPEFVNGNRGMLTAVEQSAVQKSIRRQMQKRGMSDAVNLAFENSYSGRQAVQFKAHLGEQLGELNRLSLFHPDRLSWNLSNYSPQIARQSREFAKGHLLHGPNPFPNNYAASHLLDSFAGGEYWRFAGWRDSGINSSIGAQWKTRRGFISPGSFHH